MHDDASPVVRLLIIILGPSSFPRLWRLLPRGGYIRARGRMSLVSIPSNGYIAGIRGNCVTFLFGELSTHPFPGFFFTPTFVCPVAAMPPSASSAAYITSTSDVPKFWLAIVVLAMISSSKRFEEEDTWAVGLRVLCHPGAWTLTWAFPDVLSQSPHHQNGRAPLAPLRQHELRDIYSSNLRTRRSMLRQKN